MNKLKNFKTYIKDTWFVIEEKSRKKYLFFFFSIFLSLFFSFIFFVAFKVGKFDEVKYIAIILLFFVLSLWYITIGSFLNTTIIYVSQYEFSIIQRPLPLLQSRYIKFKKIEKVNYQKKNVYSGENARPTYFVQVFCDNKKVYLTKSTKEHEIKFIVSQINSFLIKKGWINTL